MFRRIGGAGSAYFLAHTGEGLQTTSYPRCVYINPAADASSLTMDQAWDGDGVFVFPTADQVEPEQLIQRVDIARADHPNWRMIWLNAYCGDSGLAITGPGDSATVAEAANIDATPNMRLGIPRGATVAVDHDESVLRIRSSHGFWLMDLRNDVLGEVAITLLDGGTFSFEAEFTGGLDATVDLRTGADHHRFPVFAVPSGRRLVRFDPGEPTATTIELDVDHPLTTGYRTTLGQPIELRTEASWLAPQITNPETGTVSLTPGGVFRPISTHKMVAGLSGAESFQIDPETTVEFHPGNPAFVDDDLLRSNMTTAWLSLAGTEEHPVTYSSQPLNGGFHRLSETDFFPWFDVATANVNHDDVVPVIPYGLFVGDNETAKALENRAVVTQRAAALADRAKAEPPERTEEDEVVAGVTSAGTRASFRNGAMQSVELLQLGGRSVTIDVSGNPALRAGFATENHFIVMSRRPPFEEEEPGATLDGWQVEFDESSWATQSTILILKQHAGLSIEELASTPAAWTLARDFNDDPAKTAAALATLIASAETSSDRTIAALYRDVLKNPTWRGTLFLSCAVPTDKLPEDLAGLAPGVDGRFEAHHLGIGHRAISDKTSETDAEDPLVESSLFGLISYVPRAAKRTRAGGYSFAVDSLRVELADSRIQSFAATVKLGLGSFLGSAISTDAGDNTNPLLTLIGHEQRRNGKPHYLFTSNGVEPLDLDDATLASVHLAETQLETTIAGQVIINRFHFSGSLHLHGPPEDEPDIFGYRQMRFRGIDLTMSVDGSQQEGTPRWDWRTDRATLDAAPTPESLTGSFPITPVGLISGDGTPPTSSGFQVVKLPTKTEPLTEHWHGIRCRIDLGTMGGLASIPGFEADIGLFWSPHRSRRQTAVGLRFPGFDVGGYGFSLQDMLKLKAHGLAIHIDDSESGNAQFRLILEGLGIELLGFGIPWAGSFDVTVKPSPDGDRVGWYGAWDDPSPKTISPDIDEQDRAQPAIRGEHA